MDSRRDKMGRFMIQGSVSPGLMNQVSEFLTGRIAAYCWHSLHTMEKKGRASMTSRSLNVLKKSEKGPLSEY